jgi:hypothetical protein
MSEKRPTIEEIDAETEELLRRATTLKEKVIEDTTNDFEEYSWKKNIQHLDVNITKEELHVREAALAKRASEFRIRMQEIAERLEKLSG